MSIDRKSVGKFCRMFLWSSFVFILSCAVVTVERPAKTQPTSEPVSTPTEKKAKPEVSLAEDRKTVEELRQNIPEPIRSDNDLLKETLSLLGEVKLPPQRHRQRFDRLMRKIRDKHQKQTRKEREQFTKKQKKDRDQFLATLKKEREEFKDKKTERDERKEFYDQQDARRKEYFANERDARKEFDSEMHSRNSDFNALMRDRQKDFSEELRVYKKNYDEMLKQKKAERKRSVTAPPTTKEPQLLKAGDDSN